MLTFFMEKMAAVVILLLLSPFAASADIYKYIDENGVLCYTDAPMEKPGEKVRMKQSATVEATQRERPSSRDGYSHYVHKAATKYSIEPDLINAVIKTESNGNSLAVSRKGAMGLMQLMPSTASDMNVINPFDPEENIEGGTRYLRFLLEKFNGDLTLALAAYNAGPTTVEKYGSIPPITETKQYVKKVFSLYRGKKNYDVEDTVKQPSPTRIFKVVLADGTVLFTNSSLTGSNKARF